MGTFKSEPYSTTYSGETYPLGSTRVEPAAEVTAGDASLTGDRVWMFVKADGTGVSANDLLQRNAAASSYVAQTSTASADRELMNLLGVAQHAIAANQYGWVIVKGECVVKTAGVSAGNNLTSITTAGTGGPATGGATDSFAVFGRAITATGSGVSDAYVDFR